MSSPVFRRPRHQIVAKALAAFDAGFLEQTQCYFGGGTRIVLELAEYRESEDLDFLCASRDGYRTLRTAVTDRSLGPVLARPVPLARDVRADQYGVRTFLEVDGHRLKCEIIREGRIDLAGALCETIPVPCLDRPSCLAEKWLANADRWADEAVLSRDIVDLAFMVETWPPADVRRGLALAREAYGASVDRAALRAAEKLLEGDAYLKRCVRELGVEDIDTLRAGLERVITIV